MFEQHMRNEQAVAFARSMSLRSFSLQRREEERGQRAAMRDMMKAGNLEVKEGTSIKSWQKRNVMLKFNRLYVYEKGERSFGLDECARIELRGRRRRKLLLEQVLLLLRAARPACSWTGLDWVPARSGARAL